MKRKRNPSPGSSAFTQVELLVVLACLAILATILVPAMHAAQVQRGRLRVLTALRTYGTGIDLYVDDHDGVLPGPTNFGQGPSYSKSKKKSLVYRLWPYVGGNPPGSRIEVQIVALVDVYREQLGFPTIYLRNPEVMVDGVQVDPFGYPTIATKPISFYAIESPSSEYAIRDVSKEDVPVIWGWHDSLPEKALYGTINALYFDGHVGQFKP